VDYHDWEDICSGAEMTSVADVLIIGAGASGGVAALRFAEAGFHVVCLEQGDWTDVSSYPGGGPEWELAIGKQWSSSPNIRQNPADYPIDDSNSDLTITNFNGVGGSTVMYAAIWPRMLPYDFQTRSLAGVGDDWPLGYDELLPFYERVDRQVGVSGLGGNPAYPPGEDPPLPALPIGRRGMLVARAHAKLGWHWWPESNAILSRPFAGRHVCVQRGVCSSGCSEGAKASVDVTHWPAAIARGAQLITGGRVRRIVVDKNGRASGAEWVDGNGHEHFQPATVVLCAANGVGTPRLLLASASGVFAEGLANSSGLVGRRLMLHPAVGVVGYFDEPLDSWQGHTGSAISSLEFYGGRHGRDFVGGCKWSLNGTGGPLSQAMALGKGPTFGAEHQRAMRERFGRTARWVLICEDQADDDNRVELSATLTDSSGLPAPQVFYRISENSQRILDWNVERATESLYTAGAHDVIVSPFSLQAHLMGTARMGDDPATSVVDRWSMTHDIPNLGIIDGSAFVTAGAVNPTATITALALRAADHLIERRGDVEAPEQTSTFSVSARPSPPPAATAAVRMGAPFSSMERDRLRSVASALLPEVEGMPAAGDVGVADGLLDWVLAVRPDLAAPLHRVLNLVDRSTEDLMATLLDADRAGFEALVLVVLAGYYHHPAVREQIGYPGQVAMPVPAHDFPEYISEGLLDYLLT
jgi:choline dehydrogenase-like flavoprotein